MTQKPENREHFRFPDLLNTAPVGIFQTDTRGNYVGVNSYWSQLTGISAEKAQNSGWLESVHPDDRPLVTTEWAEAVAKAQEFSLVFRIGKRWVSARTAALRDEKGSALGFLGTLQDITPQKEAEEALRESKNFLSKILDSLPVALFCKDCDDEFRISLWNAGATQMWGLSAEEVLGKNDYQLFPKEQADFFREKDVETMQGGVTVEIPEEPVQAGLNKQVLVRTKKVPVADAHGRPKYLLGISEDITARREAEQLIEEQRLKIVHASRMTALGEMAAGIAHEINNPLAIIEVSASQIRTCMDHGILDTARLIKISKTISDTIERIAKIIRGLRAFARDGENEPKKPILVRDLLTEALDFCMARFKSIGIRLEVKNETKPDLTLVCRSVQISQVLLNLLNNAFDAIRGMPDPWVQVHVLSDETYLELRVTDSGPGIPAAIAAKIMQPFFTTKELGHGTGLGLSISTGIVHAHQGTLTLDDSSPTTRFVIRLPLNVTSEL